MRRLFLPLIGIAALALLIGCGGGGTNAGNKTPAPTPTSAAAATASASTSTAATPISTPFVGRDPSVSFSTVCQKSNQKQFSQPDKVIDTSKTYVATIKTAKGDIVLQLDNKAVETTNSFVFLACKGFYDGLTFHRVISGFVAQGGDPKGDGSGGPGYTIPAEFDDSRFVTGVVGLARAADPNSGGSQFFIMLADSSGLNGQYTAFGKVTSGMNVAQSLTPRDPSVNPNAPPGDAITTITITEQ